MLSLSLSQAGITALLIAARYNHFEVVKLLLDKGADVNKADEVSLSHVNIADEVNQSLKVTSMSEPSCQSCGWAGLC